jgi:nitrite reductase/ring-hydroxylating ferredoxin subunit
MVRREVEAVNVPVKIFMGAINYIDVCGEDDLWDGEMEAFDVGDYEVLLVKLNGKYHAYNGICPHQSTSLVEGELTEDGIIICKAHEWHFSAESGKGINPANACLQIFPVKVEGGRVFVGSEPDPKA